MNIRPEPAANEAQPIVVNRLRSALVHGSLAVFAVAIIAKAAHLQLVEGEAWAEIAVAQQVLQAPVTPPRGAVLDANETVLVETRELLQINIVPRNLVRTKKHGDARAIVRKQLPRLGVPAATVKRALDTSLKWVPIKGQFLPSQVKELVGLPGVVTSRVQKRQNSAPGGISRIVGTIDATGAARGGIEQEFDSLLRGAVGTRALVRDPRGIPLETPLLTGSDATPGHTIVLTLNQTLQEIAEQELAEGMRRTNSTGGDIVLVDARDGSVLALAGARDGKIAPASTALTEAYEPGSVIKPFFIAHMLDNGKTREDEIIDTENGLWKFDKRTLTDEHKAPSMSVRDIVRFSSNIGTVKLVSRLGVAEEYEVLRDFGFGLPTGVPYPAESRGDVPVPSEWTRPTAASLATGYGMTATPLQLAMAYAAIASGGELLQAGLVREIRDPEGNVVYRHERRPLRRVLTPEGAQRINTILGSVVDSGTATAARLATFDVAGKSGTARRVENRRYANGKYNATFAGMFPAQQPQYVFVARLMDPKGAYYGGVVAAPMVNAMLKAAIATRNGSLDHAALAAVAKRPPSDDTAASENDRPDGRNTRTVRITDDEPAEPAPLAFASTVEPMAEPGRIVVSLVPGDSNGATVPRKKKGKARADMREIPLVAGLNLREAVRTLNAAGFDVKLVRGSSGRTSPAAGTLARAGTTVALEMSQ